MTALFARWGDATVSPDQSAPDGFGRSAAPICAGTSAITITGVDSCWPRPDAIDAGHER
jgi:hypothetical protein